MKLSLVTYLTICLIEECAEMIQRACKSLRFGWYEKELGSVINNSARLAGEYNDLIAVIQMLRAEGIDIFENEILSETKKAKVEKYMHYSVQQGLLDPDAIKR